MDYAEDGEKMISKIVSFCFANVARAMKLLIKISSIRILMHLAVQSSNFLVSIRPFIHPSIHSPNNPTIHQST